MLSSGCSTWVITPVQTAAAILGFIHFVNECLHKNVLYPIAKRDLIGYIIGIETTKQRRKQYVNKGTRSNKV